MVSWFWVERSRLGLGLTAIRRGFELYECLPVVYMMYCCAIWHHPYACKSTPTTASTLLCNPFPRLLIGFDVNELQVGGVQSQVDAHLHQKKMLVAAVVDPCVLFEYSCSPRAARSLIRRCIAMVVRHGSVTV